MRLIDSQIHLWTDAEAAARMLQHWMSAEEIIAGMDAVGVARTYLVPGNSAANPLCVQAARRWPDRFRALCLLALDKAESRAFLTDGDDWANAGFVGLRLTFPPYRKVSWLDDGTADWLWPIADRLALPVMMWAPRRAATIGELAERWPRIRFVVDHLNLFVQDKGETVATEVQAVLPLARHANVAVKVSSLPAHSDEGYPWRDMHGYIEQAVQAFGAGRTMWGTDLTRKCCTYEEAVTMFTRELPFLQEAQLEQIMGETATRWLGW